MASDNFNNNSVEDLKKKFIEVQNPDSNFNQYYHLSSPFSAVIETYRTDTDVPYFNISSFSPDSCTHAIINDASMLEIMKQRPLHQHDFFELMFVLQGEVCVKVENSSRIYSSGTGCIMNCNLRHVELLNNDFRIFFLNISKPFLQNLFQSTNLFHFTIEQAKATSAFLFLNNNISSDTISQKEYLDFFPNYNSATSYNAFFRLAEQIISHTLSPSIGATFTISALICQLLDLISDINCYHLSQVNIDAGNDFIIFTKISHLLEDSNGRLSRSELTALLNYSGDYLNKICKRYTGMTLFEYGTTFSIRKAEYYLLKTDLTINEITTLLGYTNKSHFYKLFKSKHQMTPEAFRTRHLTHTFPQDSI
jgi:AraC-like DNA-binding protein